MEATCVRPASPLGRNGFFRNQSGKLGKKEEDDRIQRRIQAYREVIGVKRSIHLTLITTFGLAHNAYRNHVQSEVTLDDLFRD